MNELRYLNGKVLHQRLPVLGGPIGTDAPLLKRLRLPQGELAQVHDSMDPVRYLAVFETLEGRVRGNHYHLAKKESLYLISGAVRLHLEDLDSKERIEAELRAGDLVFIPPRVAHALATLEPGWVIEFAPDPLDPADSHRHPLV